jgi:predicted Fe-Mo cluster-binding NifX family protein
MMKIAIAVLDANGLDAQVSPHFGRCPYFALVETEGYEVRTIETVVNPYYPDHEPGEVPAFIHSLGAQVMLAGGMGGRAVAFFQQYGIEAATGAAGTVRTSLSRYLGGELQGAAPYSESVEHGHR